MAELLQSDKLLLPNTVCRICLTPCSNMTSIFTKFVVETECQISSKTSEILCILELLEYFTQIQVFDKFSNMICKTCVKSAYDAFMFKTKVRRTEAWLHSNVSKLKIATSKEKKVARKPFNSSNKISLEKEDNLQTIVAWLELDTKLPNKKIDYKTCENLPVENIIDLESSENQNVQETTNKINLENQKNIELLTDCKELQITETDTPQPSKKYITIVKKNITKTGSTAVKNIEESDTKKNSEITANLSPTNKDNLPVSQKSIEEKENKPRRATFGKSLLLSHRREELNKRRIKTYTRKNVEAYKLLPSCLKDHDYNIIFCEVCKEYFPNKFLYNTHKKIHTAKIHKCKFCTKKFKDFSYLKVHLKTHIDKSKSLDQIVNQHTYDINYPSYTNSLLEKFYFCELCAIGYKRITSFINHLQDVHAKDKKYGCSICPKNFYDQSDLLNHIQLHTKSLPYSCAHCPKKFDRVADITTHVKTHDADAPIVTIPYNPKLDKEDRIASKDVLPISRDKNQKIFLCSICGKRYKERYEFKAHMRHHEGKDKALCPVCGKTYRSVHLNTHMQSHTKVPSHQCNICGKMYKHKSALRLHQITHTEKMLHRCELCGKPFKLKSGLRVHMRHHNGERKHECSVCSKKFFYQSNLKIHLRIHTQETPYSCRYCDKPFIASTSCRYHEYVHEGKKPYSCKICQKSYSRPSVLSKHMSVHKKPKT